MTGAPAGGAERSPRSSGPNDSALTRADLLALTPDALAALSNRGLLKRATKEADGTSVETTPDGTVHGGHPDGARTALAPGTGLDGGTCTCPATGVCRHLLALVLAYQRDAAAPAAPEPAEAAPERWSPGEFTDEALEQLLGARQLAAARRAHRTGYTARVRRPSTVDPVPSVELATTTVRFLVPRELGYAHTDAASGARADAVALAVWAYRLADERAPGADSVDLDVGGAGADGAGAAAGSGLEPALDLAAEVLLDGVVHSGASRAAAFTRVGRDLDAAGLRWPLLALDDLADQLDAYRARAARYAPAHVAELLAELHARHRAVTSGGASLRSRVLGTEESAETPLRRVRLVSLGCRVGGAGDERTAEVFLAHAETATVLVLRRRWAVEPDPPLTGADLATRRVGGTSLATLAAGNLVTESAARSASRLVRLASNRVARTTVAPSTGAWGDLPASLLVRDAAALAREMDDLPPRLVRPRVEAEFVRVVPVKDVVWMGYRPGAQRLDAEVLDESGGTLMVSAVHRAACPAALDTLADALAGRRGALRFVSGALRRGRGGIVVDPIAVVAEDSVVVPDLAAGDGGTALAAADGPEAAEPVAAALDEALGLLAEAAHRGLRHAPASFADRLRASGRTLTRTGLAKAGAAVTALAAALGPDPDAAATAVWVDTAIRLIVTADCR